MKPNKTTTKKPDVTAHQDYRDFLKDLFEYEKKKKPKFSSQFCASRLGTSKSYLKLVIEKKRQMRMRKISLIWELFKLSPFEQQYFTLLFLKTTADDQKLIEYFDNVLARLRHRLKYSGSHEGKESSDEKEVVFRDWFYMAIHSLVRLEGFQPDVEWIQNKLAGTPVDRAEIKHALDELLRNGSIIEQEGCWRPDEFVFRSPQEYDDDQFKIYKVGLHRVDEILNNVRKHRPSHFHMMSICLNEQDRETVFNLYIELRDKIIQLSKESKKPTQVFFISNNIFSVSK